MPRRGLGPEKKKDAKRTARRQIARPRSIAAASLEEQSITEAEQATNSTDSRVLASGTTNAERAVDSNHIKDGSVTRAKIPTNAVSGNELAPGSVADAHISGTLGKNKLPNDVNYGRVRAADLDFGEGRPIPSGKVDPGYPYDDLKNPPALGAFLKNQELKGELKKHLKPSAFK